MPNEPFSKEKYKICLKWIRASARSFSLKFRSGHVDYWDFFSEGILTFTLCIRKWVDKGRNPEDKEFDNYFRQALSNNNKELLGKVFAQKRRGYFKPKGKPCYGNFDENNIECGACDKKEGCQNFFYKSDVSLDQALHVKSDGGFDEVNFQELVKHVKKNLPSSIEKYIFMLIVDPPKGLNELAIREDNKKMRAFLFKKDPSKGGNSVRPTGQLIIKYLCENGCPITQNEFYAYRKRIQAKVLEVVKGEK